MTLICCIALHYRLVAVVRARIIASGSRSRRSQLRPTTGRDAIRVAAREPKTPVSRVALAAGGARHLGAAGYSGRCVRGHRLAGSGAVLNRRGGARSAGRRRVSAAAGRPFIAAALTTAASTCGDGAATGVRPRPPTHGSRANARAGRLARQLNARRADTAVICRPPVRYNLSNE